MSEQRPQSAVQGIAAMLAASLSLVIMAFAGQSGVGGFAVAQVVFFRNIIGIVPIGGVIGSTSGFGSIRTKRYGSHLFSGLSMLFSLLTYFASLKYLPIATVVMLSFSYPLFMAAMSAPILKERVPLSSWLAITAGFCGVLIALGPMAAFSDTNMLIGSVFGILSAIFTATCWINVRRMADTENTSVVAVSTMIVPLVGCALALPFVWRTPAVSEIWILLLVGAGGGIGQLCIAHAYRAAPPAVVLPFYYFQLVWTILFSYLLWGQTPSVQQIVGGLIIVGAGLYIALKPARPAPARKANA